MGPWEHLYSVSRCIALQYYKLCLTALRLIADYFLSLVSRWPWVGRWVGVWIGQWLLGLGLGAGARASARASASVTDRTGAGARARARCNVRPAHVRITVDKPPAGAPYKRDEFVYWFLCKPRDLPEHFDGMHLHSGWARGEG